MPSAPADVVIDADPAPPAIDAALTRLEGLAREPRRRDRRRHRAAGQRRSYRALGAGLEARGVALVPVSAMIARVPGPAAQAAR